MSPLSNIFDLCLFGICILFSTICFYYIWNFQNYYNEPIDSIGIFIDKLQTYLSGDNFFKRNHSILFDQRKIYQQHSNHILLHIFAGSILLIIGCIRHKYKLIKILYITFDIILLYGCIAFISAAGLNNIWLGKVRLTFFVLFAYINIISLIGIFYSIYYKQKTKELLWFKLNFLTILMTPIYHLVYGIMHKFIVAYNNVNMDYIGIAGLYPSLIILLQIGIYFFNITNKRNLINNSKQLTGINPIIFKIALPCLNFTAFQWFLLFAWEDISIDGLGVVAVNILCLCGILSSIILYQIRCGNFIHFNKDYISLMPLLLLSCLLVSIQIFYRAYNHPYLFQIVQRSVYIYKECALWYWLSKAVLLLIESIAVGTYYIRYVFLNKKDGDNLMEWMTHLNHSCSTLLYLMIAYFCIIYLGIEQSKNVEITWNIIFIIESIVKFVLPLLWIINESNSSHINDLKKHQ